MIDHHQKQQQQIKTVFASINIIFQKELNLIKTDVDEREGYMHVFIETTKANKYKSVSVYIKL